MAKLLIDAGVDIESKNDNGWTPLILGIFLNYAFPLNYYFFIFIASRNGHIEVAKFLMERGADVESKDRHGQTPLIIGIFFNHAFHLIYLLFFYL